MLKVLEIYGWIRVGAIDLIAMTPAGYRGFVMNFYDNLQKKYYDSLLAELRLDMVNDEIVIHETVSKDKSAVATMTADVVEEDDVAEDGAWGSAEVGGGFDEPGVGAGEGGDDGPDHEGEEVVDHAEETGGRGVEPLTAFRDEAESGQGAAGETVTGGETHP
jgi:hypothetical protein